MATNRAVSAGESVKNQHDISGERLAVPENLGTALQALVAQSHSSGSQAAFGLILQGRQIRGQGRGRGLFE
jgi:hypothetical protein